MFGKRRNRTGIFWPSAAFAVVVLLVLAAAALGAVSQFNAQGNDLKRQMVESGFAQKVNEVRSLVVPQVVWDDAIRNLDNRYSPSWAQQNISLYLHQTYGFDRTMIVDFDNQIRAPAIKGQAANPAALRDLYAAAADVIDDVRTMENRRGPLKPPSKPGVMIGRPMQQSQIARIGNHFAIISATLVQPDFGTAMPQHALAPILVSQLNLDGNFIRGFAERYQLSGLRFEGMGPVPNDGDVRVVLATEDGVPVARMVWHPRNLGYQLLRELFLPAFAIVALLALATLLLLLRNQRMMDQVLAGEAHAKHLAYYDALTGLANRVAFHEQAMIAIGNTAPGQQTAIFGVDLDRFKEVNDLLGHHAGDQLIRYAGQTLAELCRGQGQVARLSGDEFAIVCPGTTVEAASALAQALCDRMRAPVDLDSGRVFIGCSIGVAMVTSDLIDSNEALRRADLALYRAKREGRGRFALHVPEMDRALLARRSLETDLRQALDDGAIGMVYQPQVNRRGEVHSVEALARWHHPQRGWVSPSEFVPLAEERGLIAEFGAYVFRRVFTETRDWSETRVAINVSATQLRMHDFVTSLAELAEHYGIDPSRYELEITESVLLQENDDILDRLHALRRLGFRLVLDDFGTGYSALSYLRKFPIDKIKIDRSFVASMGRDPEADAIVGAIIRLARALHLAVIAEGVETIEQRLRLASTGCWDVQGYLYGQPLGASRVYEILSGEEQLPGTCAA